MTSATRTVRVQPHHLSQFHVQTQSPRLPHIQQQNQSHHAQIQSLILQTNLFQNHNQDR